MNKKIRRDLTYLKYKKRVSQLVQNMDVYITNDGDWIYNPKVVDVLKDRGFYILKTSSVLCSCYMCAGESYNRAKKKKEDRKYLNE